MGSRLQTICELVSNVDHNHNTELQQMNQHSNFQRFIHERSDLIYAKLNNLYNDFALRTLPQFDGSKADIDIGRKLEEFQDLHILSKLICDQ